MGTENCVGGGTFSKIAFEFLINTKKFIECHCRHFDTEEKNFSHRPSGTVVIDVLQCNELQEWLTVLQIPSSWF